MLSSALFITGSVYVLLSALLFVFQGRFVYFPSRDVLWTPAAIDLPFEEIYIPIANEQDAALHGWYIPHPAPRGQILFFHGNGGNISHRLDSLKIFHDLGLAILIFDYQGYGLSHGRPSEPATYADAEAALQFLLQHDPAKDLPLIFFGRSLGGGVASWLAQKHAPRVLILESSFTSVMDMGRHYYPFLPVSLLTRYRYDTLSRIGALTCPVLVVHSPEDDIVPYELGQRLYQAAPQPKTFLEIRGGHNEGFIISGDQYINGLRAFLDNHL